MAIVFNSAVGQAGSAGTGTASISNINLTGVGGYLTAAVAIETSAQTVSSFNLDDGSGGSVQALTQIGTDILIPGSSRLVLYRLLAPSTSANRRLIVTVSGTSNLQMGASYYTGVDQTTPIADVQQGTDGASPASQLNTSNLDGSYQAGFIWAVLINSLTGGVNRQNVQSAADIGYLLDSNTGINNGSTNTFSWSWTGGVATSGWVTYMLRPTATAATGNFLRMF